MHDGSKEHILQLNSPILILSHGVGRAQEADAVLAGVFFDDECCNAGTGAP